MKTKFAGAENALKSSDLLIDFMQCTQMIDRINAAAQKPKYQNYQGRRWEANPLWGFGYLLISLFYRTLYHFTEALYLFFNTSLLAQKKFDYLINSNFYRTKYFLSSPPGKESLPFVEDILVPAANHFHPLALRFLLEIPSSSAFVKKDEYSTEDALQKSAVQGGCLGGAYLFGQLAFQTARWTNPEAQLVKIAKQFRYGIPPQGLVYQATNDFSKLPPTALKWINTLYVQDRQDKQISSFIWSADPGVYHINVAERTEPGHSFSLVVTDSERYIEDLNFGLVKLSEENFPLILNCLSEGPLLIDIFQIQDKAAPQATSFSSFWMDHPQARYTAICFYVENKIQRSLSWFPFLHSASLIQLVQKVAEKGPLNDPDLLALVHSCKLFEKNPELGLPFEGDSLKRTEVTEKLAQDSGLSFDVFSETLIKAKKISDSVHLQESP